MKKIVIAIMCVWQLTIALSQPTEDDANLEKYWKYRRQLKDRFMKIGPNDAESLPMSCIIPNHHYGPGTTTSVLHWRDATITLGYYYVVLATEYRLLKDDGKDVLPTLN